MILQALTHYYETLLENGTLSPPGWDDGFKVSFGLVLARDGTLTQIIPYKETVQRGKKSVEVPQTMKVPAHVNRRSDVAANFLCDNAAYMLGIDTKGKPERTLRCFEACRDLHEEILKDVDTAAAYAIRNFFKSWKIAQAETNAVLAPFWKEITGAANLIFCCEDVRPVTETDPAVCTAWQEHYSADGAERQLRQCLVTGKIAPIARIHPVVKGVRGAQSMGTSLVSFKAPALESFGHSQGENAPISEYAAFAYTTALNTLLAKHERCSAIGDTTVVCWAEHGENAYQDFSMAMMFGAGPAGITDADITAALKKLAKGQSIDWNGIELQPDEHFYFLGLSPNAARLSVRFFLRDSFGSFAKNIDKHYADTAVVRPSFDSLERLPLWRLLDETVNQNSRSKDPAPQLVGDMLRAILEGTRYPASLINNTELRIRAERKVSRGRAAIIKAYYLRHPHSHCPEEVLKMELNEECTHIPYVLGRLFSVLEQIQEKALPNLNATIRDKYFNSASSTPAIIFPQLIDKAQSHLRVLRRNNTGAAIALEKKMSLLMGRIGTDFPSRLDLPERGSFQLGYYFENQAKYTKKV